MQFLIAFVAGFMIPMLVAVSAFADDASLSKMGVASKKEPGVLILDHAARVTVKDAERKVAGL